MQVERRIISRNIPGALLQVTEFVGKPIQKRRVYDT